jgi:hypothetical protein
MKERFELSMFYLVATILTTIAILIGFLCMNARAEDWTDAEIVRAIYYAEGGADAKKPFGILSVPCDSYEECKRICENTVRNNRVRYARWGHKKFDSYLEFLASRYAPTEAKNDPTGLNKNWLGNVQAILKRGRR